VTDTGLPCEISLSAWSTKFLALFRSWSRAVGWSSRALLRH
jgi:hypothetical protein